VTLMLTPNFSHRTPACVALLACSLLLLTVACRSTKEQGAPSSIIVVSAPSAGIVRRVVVAEGVRVEAGTPIVEIAVPVERPAVTPSPGESAESLAVRNVRSAGAEIEAARAEVVRHEAEVSRLTPLVTSGEASQAQLDGERALYERAQQRLQKAQEAERSAQTGLLAARQPGMTTQANSAAPAPAPREQIVSAQASSAGTVRVINARVGDRVTAGQPLATLSTDGP
jgi:multidrug efflux pump subunit AcrA (membrane-fusion protein)